MEIDSSQQNIQIGEHALVQKNSKYCSLFLLIVKFVLVKLKAQWRSITPDYILNLDTSGIEKIQNCE